MPAATLLKDLEAANKRLKNLLAEQVFENGLIKDALRYQPKPDRNMELRADPGAGTLAHWHIGTLAHWHIGTLAHWHIGTLAHWHIGTLAHWHKRHGVGM